MARPLALGALVALACLPWACFDYQVDPDGFCQGRPDDPSCPGAGGAAGASGMGGVGGVGGVGGSGGSAMGSAGLGGSGSGGGGPCASDAACGAELGAGSLCVGDACTAPSMSCTKATLVVVPGEADESGIDGALVNACHYRDLAPALVDATQNGSATTGVVVYASAVTGPAIVSGGVRLEGRPTAPATLVALTLGASGAGGGAGAAGSSGAGGSGPAALVTLGAGSALTGFALDGKSVAAGVRAEAGAVRLEGPLTIANATRAVDLGGAVEATVTGLQATPVRLSANQQGIVVGATAKLGLTGDGDKGGVTVEGTTAGAGVLVLAGEVGPAVQLEGLLAKNNKMGTIVGGVGGVELRQGRSVTVKGSVFEGNQQALTLNGEKSSSLTSFTNIVLEGNRFTLPTPGQGSTICGSKLGSQTELNLGPGNVFPLAMMTCPPAQAGSCNTGADVGYDSVNQFALVCGGS